MNVLNQVLVFLGSALMVYNIVGFVRFARYVRTLNAKKSISSALVLPIVLLVLFLLGYLSVGFFGRPDPVISGILFGGSVFVFVMYRMLSGITREIVENEHLKSRLTASEETSRTRDALLASISHEMRTPLNVILGMDSAIMESGDLSPETKEKLDKISQSAKTMLRLVNNMLDSNSVAAGTFALQSEPFPLRPLLEDVSAETRERCAEKGLTCECDPLPDLPGRVLGDGPRLRQVLESLLDNAVKFTDPPGNVRFSVESLPEEKGVRRFRFTVSDTGCGMSPGFLPRVFDPFAREDEGSTSRHGGGGLGLALTKRIVDAMGGEIAVQSEKGRGSVFTVTLPLAPAAEEVTLPPPEEDLPSLSGRRVLIVEDVPENAEIVQDLLELEGVESDHAENGREALDLFGRFPAWHYDAVLMDLRMPVMDGLEATRRMRAMNRPDARGVPIIALSANAFESDIRQSLASGMNAHLAKPADADLLYRTLREQLRNHPNPKGGKGP